MTTFGWRSERSIEEWLFTEPYRFEFFQAARLLEILKREVRFHSRVGLAFPASEVQQIEHGEPVEMTVNFLGLAGAFGPLAPPDTEMVLDRIRSKDYAPRDFLDIFNHRLVSLMYQVRKLHRLSLTSQPPETTRIARYLYSFFGLGIPALQNRMRTPDRALLGAAGILSQQPRSAVGLERLLSHYFKVNASVRQLVGRWRRLEPDQWTRIGTRLGCNRKLGDGAVLGTRVWDQQGSFVVQLGPMGREQFSDFLPTGLAYRPLCEMTRFYAGPEFEFAFRFTLDAEAVPETLLGTARLGWTSWLKTRAFSREDSQVWLRPA